MKKPNYKPLEFKDICGYLPYGLKQINKNPNHKFYNKIYNYGIINVDWYAEDNEYHKLILRPLSDLYKTITHNGKEIVPIVESAKIEFEFSDWEGWELDGYIYNYATENQNYIKFYFSDGCFWCENIEREIFHIEKQYQLFDYLHELKIDYRGLIDAGLAVDVNTLNENPYK